MNTIIPRWAKVGSLVACAYTLVACGASGLQNGVTTEGATGLGVTPAIPSTNINNNVSAPEVRQLNTSEILEAQTLYNSQCLGCHGVQGEGTANGNALVVIPGVNHYNKILNGMPKANPANCGDRCSDLLNSYILTGFPRASSGVQPAPVVPAPATPAPTVSPQLNVSQISTLSDDYERMCQSCHGADGESTIFAQIYGNSYTTAKLTSAIQDMFDRSLAQGDCSGNLQLSCSESIAEFIFTEAGRFNVTRIDTPDLPAGISAVYEEKCQSCHDRNGRGVNGNPGFNGTKFPSEADLIVKINGMFNRAAGGSSCANGESGFTCATSLANFFLSEGRFDVEIGVDNDVVIESVTYTNSLDAQASIDIPVARSTIESERRGATGDVIVDIEISGISANDDIELVLTDPTGDEKFVLIDGEQDGGDIESSFLISLGAVSSDGIWELRLQDPNGGAFIDRWSLTFPGGDLNNGERAWTVNMCNDCHQLQLDADRNGIAVAAENRAVNDEFFQIDPEALKNTNLQGLADYIYETMPLGKHTTACREQCAVDTAAFVRSWIDLGIDDVLEFEK